MKGVRAFLEDVGERKQTGGYKNRILWVNLSQRTFSEKLLSNELIHDYIGGLASV